MGKYNNLTALKAITKASLLAILKTPQTIIFSLFFPLIFVFIFGAFGDGGAIKYKIAFAPLSDTNNILYAQIKASPFFVVKEFVTTKDNVKKIDTVAMRVELEKGNLAGILNIQKEDRKSVV